MHAVSGPVLSEGSGGPFDLINGIPVHPLVVHAAVVLVPLTALGLIVMAVWPRFSAKYGWLVVASGLVGTVSAFAAKESGEVLEGRVGEPGFDHAELGDLMPVFAAVLLVAVVALWLIDRGAPADGPAPRRGLRVAVAVVGVLIALGNLFWVYRVGDSGAKSVWAGKVSASPSEGASGTDPDAQAPTGSATSSATAATATTYSIADVATHSSAADCWVAIDAAVYDMTAFVEQHPGGAQQITDLCGRDGTDAFDGEHAGQSEPTDVLAGFEVGTLT